jgi:FkbH-like protein
MPFSHDPIWEQHNDHRYRAPVDLAVTALEVKRVLVIGSCFSEGISPYLGRVIPGAAFDHILYNYVGELPDQPPRPIETYSFQLIILPLRTIMHEGLYFRLRYDQPQSFAAAFDESVRRLVQLLAGAVKYNEQRNLLTFVANFLTPQQNALGRMVPRYNLCNPVHYVERLNEILYEEVHKRDNAHCVDLNEISATLGRRFIQDDGLWLLSHGTYANDWDFEYDRDRVKAIPPFTEHHAFRTEEFILAIWSEIAAMYKTIRQIDQVKLVIIDLDDTLWRGVVAEDGIGNPALLEGWPIGLAEALSFLKRRGILLAVVSKNDESRIAALWEQIFGGLLTLDDFAARRINWRPKADNVEEVLREVNLLPKSAVFIDDNPVERASIAQAFPEMRILGSHPYYIRRVLLWAPETQVALITAESAQRTEMVQAQVDRERSRQRMSRTEFLVSLEIKVSIVRIMDTRHVGFARCLELINKSNQFNTTGRRWTMEDCAAFFALGGRYHAFEVRDRFAAYGIVGVAILLDATIKQFVMSCRVLGLDVETAVIAWIANNSGGPILRAELVETDANFLCRDLYHKCGFERRGDVWTRSLGSALLGPLHNIQLEAA